MFAAPTTILAMETAEVERVAGCKSLDGQTSQREIIGFHHINYRYMHYAERSFQSGALD